MRHGAQIVVALSTPWLMAVAPPPDGLETDIAIGGERVSVAEGLERGDDELGWQYRYVGAVIHGHVRHRSESGLTWGGQVDLLPAFVSSADALERITADGVYSPPRYQRGEAALHGVVAGRIGWHQDRYGGEVGLALPARPGLWSSPVFAHPSGMIWAGVPSRAYLWARYLYGPTSLSTPNAGAMGGVGHASDRARLLLGLDSRLGWLTEAALEVTSGVKMGVQVTRVVPRETDVSEPNVRGLVRLTVGHERVDSQY